MKVLFDPPSLIKKIFTDFYWQSPKGRILLTFDDGPNPGTHDIILERLQKYGLKALFFCVGNNIEKNPILGRELLSCGHTLGNHTFNHQKIIFRSRKFIEKEILDTQNVAEDLLGYNMKYFRPPHGFFDPRSGTILRGLNLKCIMWSLLTHDFENNLEKVKYGVSKYLQSNSIITLHDNTKCRDIIKDSIDFIIEEVDRRGFEIGDPHETLDIT